MNNPLQITKEEKKRILSLHEAYNNNTTSLITEQLTVPSDTTVQQSGDKMIVSSSEGTYKYKFKLSYEGHEYEPTLLSSSLRDNGNRLKAKIELPWGTGLVISAALAAGKNEMNSCGIYYTYDGGGLGNASVAFKIYFLENEKCGGEAEKTLAKAAHGKLGGNLVDEHGFKITLYRT